MVVVIALMATCCCKGGDAGDSVSASAGEAGEVVEGEEGSDNAFLKPSADGESEGPCGMSPALFWAYKACSFAIRLALWPLKSSTPGKVRTQDLLAQSRFKDTLVIPRQSATI